MRPKGDVVGKRKVDTGPSVDVAETRRIVETDAREALNET